ncbi:MAG: NAD(P)/FAD-dependent oxidoreductase [Spirochaetales bacterium]|nr:NAD(P)/FAD-dependent oxidoreductase [Spirochaetales bacterium]
MAKKIAVIGAGVAGLSAASHLQRNGYDTEIFEMHNLPGGLCTAWKKQGYTFDGCIHWLVGSGPGHPLYHRWNEILDMQSLSFVEMEDFARVDDDRGNSLTLYSDADKLGAELSRHAGAKADLSAVDAMVEGVKLFALDEERDPAVKRRKGAFMVEWGRTTTVQFARKLDSPFLEYALQVLLGPGSISGLPWLMSVFHLKSAGYPIGGSLAFARVIEKRYLELGGKVRYDARVAAVMTEDDAARGIRLESGEEIKTDLVISAADGRFTIFTLLGGKYASDEIRGFYAGKNPALIPNPSWVQVSLGLSRGLEGGLHQLMWKPPRPLVVDEKAKHEVVGARIYNFDPTLAPAGHTVVIAMLDTKNGDFWRNLRHDDKAKYDAEKSRIADEYIALLDAKLGGIKDNVEVVDVSTPATAVRYTGNWQGSYMGWGWGTKVPVWTQRKLPGLRDFFMTGQWVTHAGGLPTVMMDGRATAALVCERDGKEFGSGT